MSHRTAALSASKGAVWIAVASLLVALLVPILTAQRADAAQILDRFIHMESSAESSPTSVETKYYVEFQLPNAATIGSIRVEFCNEDPLPGQACDTNTVSGDNVPDLDSSAGSAITVTNLQFGTASAATTPETAGTDNTASCTTPTLQTVSAGDTHFDIHCNAAETITTATNDYLWFEVNNPDNPTNATSGLENDSFYARIYTFSGTSATAYNAAAPPLGNYEGGVALSTAQTITVEARVQEVLNFTVGVDAAADDCAIIAGSAVDLGVLSSANVNLASTHGVAQTPNTDVACAQVTTNASDGVAIFYVGDNLAVGSTVCTDANTDVADTNLVTDQCINRDDVPDTNGAITFGNEQWGMGVSSTPDNGTTTNNLSAASEYDIDTANEYAFVPNAVTLIGSSSTVVDQEALEIDMAGTASITTPTGIYDTTLTFIATASF